MLEHQNHFDADDGSRPERHSVLIAHKLARLNVEIAAVSEVFFPGLGSLQEHGQGNLGQKVLFRC